MSFEPLSGDFANSTDVDDPDRKLFGLDYWLGIYVTIGVFLVLCVCLLCLAVLCIRNRRHRQKLRAPKNWFQHQQSHQPIGDEESLSDDDSDVESSRYSDNNQSSNQSKYTSVHHDEEEPYSGTQQFPPDPSTADDRNPFDSSTYAATSQHSSSKRKHRRADTLDVQPQRQFTRREQARGHNRHHSLPAHATTAAACVEMSVSYSQPSVSTRLPPPANPPSTTRSKPHPTVMWGGPAAEAASAPSSAPTSRSRRSRSSHSRALSPSTSVRSVSSSTMESSEHRTQHLCLDDSMHLPAASRYSDDEDGEWRYGTAGGQTYGLEEDDEDEYRPVHPAWRAGIVGYNAVPSDLAVHSRKRGGSSKRQLRSDDAVPDPDLLLDTSLNRDAYGEYDEEEHRGSTSSYGDSAGLFSSSSGPSLFASSSAAGAGGGGASVLRKNRGALFKKIWET
mmetsp:Transcript_21671/g.42998  ORF Transcript_21671/g.42998 Transcript_21671/m.42998 type:complete len:448 (-) Transcript_21671:76-1419(-)|eukprot:CAMPEP_0175142664 /NCGR_PEP_ID=MMETSP0087-20121206/12948_1 /TAXON_ID=136419 /ORGANISM="Unknown Unknown, Strain D1" /LENGTH=447 /DNA_ID=CAMNT_0016426539 /DNA_START=26 /DNA_END=1369 /DNA_ORIENTATION=+